MSKKSILSYALVTQTALALKAEGQNPTIRLVQGRIGGNAATLNEYLRRWHQEEALANTVDEGLSEAFKQALMAEFGRKVQAIRSQLETQLQQLQTQNQEMSDLLAEAEVKNTELEDQLTTEHQQHTQALLALEKKLAGAQALTTQSQAQQDKLEQQLQEANSALEVTRLEAAKAQQQAERTDTTLQKTEQQIEALQKKAEDLQQAVHEAQIRAAVAESKVQEHISLANPTQPQMTLPKQAKAKPKAETKTKAKSA